MHGFSVLIFFHPDCNCWSRSFTGSADAEASGRGLYRQWGIAPRPEDTVQFPYTIALTRHLVKGQMTWYTKNTLKGNIVDLGVIARSEATWQSVLLFGKLRHQSAKGDTDCHAT